MYIMLVCDLVDLGNSTCQLSDLWMWYCDADDGRDLQSAGGNFSACHSPCPNSSRVCQVTWLVLLSLYGVT